MNALEYYLLSNREPTKNLLGDLLKLLKPPPKLTISECADQYRYLSPEASNEQGRWHTSRVEYTRGIMDAISDPEIEMIVVQAASQMAKTEILLNTILYYMAFDPCPMLLIQPTDEMAEIFTKDRLNPMLRDCPILSGKVSEAKSRDSGNTLHHKKFKGGQLGITSSNAPAKLASRPIRVLICDELGRWASSAGREGDPFTLAYKRTKNFPNRKIIVTSSPGIKGICRVERAFESGDQRYFNVKCPHCGHQMVLNWASVVFDAKEIFYQCENKKCETHLNDLDLYEMTKSGIWIPTKETKRIASFQLDDLYSPWLTLQTRVDEFLEAKKSPETLKVWVNTNRGQTWEDDAGEEIPEDSLLKRLEDYGSASVPDNVLFLTAAVDTQDDRLECGVIGHGPDKETYWIDYRVFHGDPEKTAIWNELSQYLDSSFESAAGDVHHIACTCIDSGGHFTNEVYFFTKRNQSRRIFAIKGANTPGKPLISRPSMKNKGKVKLFTVGTDTAKEIIHARLKNETPGPSYVHIPKKPCFDVEFIKQLTSEKCVLRYRKGVQYREWVKKSSGTRNEALDIFVYNLAAYEILNPNIGALLENQQKTREKLKNIAVKPQDEMLIPDKKPRSRKRGGGWGKNW